MDCNLELIEAFIDWCAENLESAVGCRRTSLNNFNSLVEKSYTQMRSMNKTPDRMSYICGIAAGMSMMLLPENGELDSD